MPDPHTLEELKRSTGNGSLAATSPQSHLGVEDLRLLIAREHSLGRYVPQALDLLEENPLAEGDYYPGDLLHAVLDVDVTYWRANRDQWERVDEIVETYAFSHSRLSGSLQGFRDRRI
jgi:CDI immunity proteins